MHSHWFVSLPAKLKSAARWARIRLRHASQLTVLLTFEKYKHLILIEIPADISLKNNILC
jgi:hypothetical protein